MPDPSTRIARNEVFFIGAGFSKSANENMPLMDDLNTFIRGEFADDALFTSKRLSRFVENNNFEGLLSYLSVDSPWKDPAEYWEDKSLFHRIAGAIAEEIVKRESTIPPPHELPLWIQKLVLYFDWFMTPVITFNYDTIIERVAWSKSIYDDHSGSSYAKGIQATHMYPPTLQDVRRGKQTDPLSRTTFQLIKLHGSINWFYSGTDSFPGEQVYFAETQKNNPNDDYNEVEQYVRNKSRLIIPPVNEKTTFYSNFIVRSAWKQAQEALANAEKVFFIGYSLPETDMTTRQLLLSSVKSEAEVYVVSKGDRTSPKKIELMEHYRRAMPQVISLSDQYISETCVEDLAWDLLGANPHAYNQHAKEVKDAELSKLWEQR